MAEEIEKKPELAKLRKETGFLAWLKKHCPWLFNWQSLFYFGIFCFLVGIGWTAYSLVNNSFTQLLNWDYTWQFLPFAYSIYDDWHAFFTTGQFPLYSAKIFLGTDNIGSNSYYGLFDPFIVIFVFFPRAWIPQLLVISTFLRITVAVFMMRGYLRSLGIQEWTARFGALAFGFSGYMCFMVGFPTTVAACTWFPLILWGIELVLQKQKPTALIVGLFLEGITSFFFLVVACIWGVIYAVWRFFWTIKTRDGKTNVQAMVMGVASFAIGLMLCSFTLLPSLRETMLSGRTQSIGTMYLHAVLESLSSHDLREFFALIFEQVGDNPGREVMALVSFFFPTGGYTQLPLTRSNGYDAWTAAIFCYTPCVILFFSALIYSIKERKWSHILAVVFSVWLLFTNFSYFFFYAFSGNGYGRWFIALVPEIIFYACWAFDQRKKSSRWVPFVSSVLALLTTILVYVFVENLLKDQFFTNFNNSTYWQSSYITASQTYNGIQGCWFLYYQLGLIVVEGVLLMIGHKSKWLPKAMTIAVAIEAIVMGNLTYAYNGLWSYEKSFVGGTANRETSQVIAEAINRGDSSYFRTYSDTFRGSNYYSNVAGVNGSASFHSLLNFEVEDFALANHMKYPGSTMAGAYGSDSLYNPTWSGFYANKRMGTDFLLGYRYYVLENEYASWKDADGNPLFPSSNVPFFSEEIVDASPNRDKYRIYRVSEDYMPQLGWAVDSSKIYRIGHKEDGFYRTDFFSYTSGASSFRELQRQEQTQLYGAIIPDDAELPSSFVVQDQVPAVKNNDANLASAYGLTRLSTNSGLSVNYYLAGVSEKDGFLPASSADYASEGPAYFYNHYKEKVEGLTSSRKIVADKGHVSVEPSSGTYFNNSYEGCYIELKHYESSSKTTAGYDVAPRIYAIGDTADKTNQLLSFEYHCVNNMRSVGSNHDYYRAESSTIGLYCRGKVKSIVFCYPGSKQIQFTAANISMTVEDYPDLMAKVGKIQEDKLQNVQTQTNSFTFTTSYKEDRLVVTQLGFDQGWACRATLPGGEKRDCQMLKLDGGLVGFVAPSATDSLGNPLEVSYVLYYTTPYLKLSGVLAALGLASYGGWTAYVLIKRKKKKAASEAEAAA